MARVKRKKKPSGDDDKNAEDEVMESQEQKQKPTTLVAYTNPTKSLPSISRLLPLPLTVRPTQCLHLPRPPELGHRVQVGFGYGLEIGFRSGTPVVHPDVPQSTQPTRAPDAPQNTVHAHLRGRLSRPVRGRQRHPARLG